MTRTHITHDALVEIRTPGLTAFDIRPWPCSSVSDEDVNDDNFSYNIYAYSIKGYRARGEFKIPTCSICAGLMLEALADYARKLEQEQRST